MDLYRLPNGCDLSILGIPSIFANSITLIEWPQRIDIDVLPSSYLEIDITIEDGETRVISFTSIGNQWNDKIDELDLIVDEETNT